MKKNFREIAKKEFEQILKNDEGDYSDFISADALGSRMQDKVVEFANSEGGIVYVGINDRKEKIRLGGFDTVEDAAKVIDAAYRDINPRIENLEHEFLNYNNRIIAKLIVPSSSKIHENAKGQIIVRKGAQKVILKDDEDIQILKYKKGVSRYEEEIKNIDIRLFLSSKYFSEFLKKIGYSGNKIEFLKKNNFIYNNKPRISAILCFLDCPQSVIKSGVKIIRYEHQKYSRKYAYKRERVSDEDYTIEGPVETLIRESVGKVNEIIPDYIKYPKEAILEAIANAVLHRDYYLQNETQIKIYDNRIEIVSPGGFAGGITVKNIYKHERFARNQQIFRTIFKISSIEKKRKDRLNQDQGEGVKTILNSMRKAGLADPEFEEKDNSIIVVLKHVNMESYEKKILKYLERNETIANKQAREITGEEDKEKIKNVFKKLINRGEIEIAGHPMSKSKFKYKLKNRKIIQEEMGQGSFW
ncbi:MAG TPA: ATP-binding protein [Candidatus Pacearchaeota archaeon]|nr:ATP-binding protein [Candidatus Pacearchaeota archaeon]